MTDTAPARSELFGFSETYVSDLAATDPSFATMLGIPGYDHLLPEYTTERWARDAAFTQRSLEALRAIEPIDDIDRVAGSVMDERLSARAALEHEGELARTFCVLTSPVSDTRQIFELTPTDTAEQRATFVERLGQVRPSLATWREGLLDVAERGELPPRRHIIGVAKQAATIADGAYASIIAQWDGSVGDASAAKAAAEDADAACGELAEWLEQVIAPRATEVEGCGKERYARWARYYTGTDLDFDELYEWGWQDLKRINARMWELAKALAPGAKTLGELAEALDADDSRAIFGTEALIERLESFTADAITALDGVHFDIDERIRRCDARLAPEGSAAAAYYIPPSEDLSRPGTTWFPTLGETRFPWWRSASTWYHEAVPGHHLQNAISLLAIDRLSRFQRLAAWTSGYGEGWALYAERLMDELGGFPDPADEVGYLQGQALRAARIVVDLGLHLGYAAPSDLGELTGFGDCSGKPWTPEMAVALLVDRALEAPVHAASEIDRYLGIPGQAISYKVGERVWMAVREDARTRLGTAFDLKKFHSYTLRLGPMGLDPFRDEVAQWSGD